MKQDLTNDAMLTFIFHAATCKATRLLQYASQPRTRVPPRATVAIDNSRFRRSFDSSCCINSWLPVWYSTSSFSLWTAISGIRMQVVHLSSSRLCLSKSIARSTALNSFICLFKASLDTQAVLMLQQLTESSLFEACCGNVMVLSLPKVRQGPPPAATVDQRLAPWRHTTTISWS